MSVNVAQMPNETFGFNSKSKLLPRTIKIVVHRGKNLSYQVKNSSESDKTMKWRLIFYGGAKKLASSIIDEPHGNPVWNCEVEITAKNPIDPIVIMVEDAKRRQIGQVLLNLQEIPREPIPDLYETNLQHAKLDVTKKNPNPSGFISYWIGTVDYWPEDVDIRASMYKTKSLRKSLSSLGSAIFRTGTHKSGEDGASNISGMSKFKKLREKYRGNKANRDASFTAGGSYLGSESNISRSQVAAQLSRNSSMTSLSKEMTGWNNGTNGSILGPREGSSYNPIAADSDSDVDKAAAKTKMKSSTSTFTLAHEKNGGFLKKVKSKLSKSTQNLSEIGSKLKSQTIKNKAKNSKSSVVDDVGAAGSQLRTRTDGSGMNGTERNRQSNSSINPFGGSDSEEDGTGNPFNNVEFTVAENQLNTPQTQSKLQVQSNNGSMAESPFTIRNGQAPKQNPAGRPFGHNRMLSGTSDLFQLMNGGDMVSPANDSHWGMHPEERPAASKPISEMNRQEITQYIHTIEEQNKKIRNDYMHLSHEKEQLERDYESASTELASVRKQLGDLRLRLLSDNQTQYLEVETNDEDERKASTAEGLRKGPSSALGLSTSNPGPTSSIMNPLRALANSNKQDDHFNWW